MPQRSRFAFPTRGTPTRWAGFTLIELLVVLVIVSIGLAAGMPKINAITTEQRVNRTALVVASDIRSAYTSAARGRVPVRISVPGATSKITITNRVTGDTIVKRDFSGNGVLLRALSGSGMTMDVFPNGVSTASDTIEVKNGSYLKRVTVSRVGFVRVIP
jgi:prepilin-type N-terminal cleavage/methylation domain-containing protein